MAHLGRCSLDGLSLCRAPAQSGSPVCEVCHPSPLTLEPQNHGELMVISSGVIKDNEISLGALPKIFL